MVIADASPAGLVRSAKAHWRLTWQLAQRSVVGRYRGSLFGLAWTVFNPLLMLSIYTWIFADVFKARWHGAETGDKLTFALNLFVGIIVHGFFAECVNQAPTTMIGNANYIKKVVFPLEVLPAAALGGPLFHAAVSLSILLVASAAIGGGVHASVLFAPVIIAPLVLFTGGAAWVLASLGVYIRDIAQVTGVFTTVLLFLSPVFYPVSAAPDALKFWLRLNPLTWEIEWLRGALLAGEAPPAAPLAAAWALGALAAWIGFWWFQKTRKGFADVV